MPYKSTCLSHPNYHLNRKAQEAEIIKSLWGLRPLSKQRPTDDIKERITSLYQHGYNIAEIAEWFYQDNAKIRKIIISGSVNLPLLN